MATSNTKFRVEHGLDVIGTANVSGPLRVQGDLIVEGNSVVTGSSTGDLIPTSNIFSLGNTTNRWSVFSLSLSAIGNVTSTDTAFLNLATIATSLLPTTNNITLGSTTRRWDAYANGINALNVTLSANATLANATVSNTLIVGNTSFYALSNTTHVFMVGQTLSVNTGSKLAVYATGNTSYSNLSLINDVTAIAGNVVFDTDLFFLDAVNNRVGVKNTTPSAAAILTITGNVEFSTINTAVRFATSNASQNAAVTLAGNTTNTRLTFSSFDSGTATESGGFIFAGVNATTTQTLLSFTSASFQYKAGNVAHAGNFGIYNVSGTRVGP